MRRIMARHIIYVGVDHGLSIAEFTDQGSVEIVPFYVEVCGTAWIDGCVEIYEDASGSFAWRELPDSECVN